MAFEYVLPADIPVSCDPLPIKNDPEVTTILPVADINPLVIKLPPVMLAADVIVDVALINPSVNKLPLVTLPVTDNTVNVPTDVILACALAVTYCDRPALPAAVA